MKKRSQVEYSEKRFSETLTLTPVGGTRKIFFPSIQLENASSFTFNLALIRSKIPSFQRFSVS